MLREDNRIKGNSRLHSDERGPTQKQVWGFAKELGHAIAAQAPIDHRIYVVSKRRRAGYWLTTTERLGPHTRVNLFRASAPEGDGIDPVKWSEVERGISIDDFRMDNVPARVRRLGEPVEPLLAKRGRFKLEVNL